MCVCVCSINFFIYSYLYNLHYALIHHSTPIFHTWNNQSHHKETVTRKRVDSRCVTLKYVQFPKREAFFVNEHAERGHTNTQTHTVQKVKKIYTMFFFIFIQRYTNLIIFFLYTFLFTFFISLRITLHENVTKVFEASLRPNGKIYIFVNRLVHRRVADPIYDTLKW